MIYFLFYCVICIFHATFGSISTEQPEDGGFYVFLPPGPSFQNVHNPSLTASSLHAVLRIILCGVWFGSHVAYPVTCAKRKRPVLLNVSPFGNTFGHISLKAAARWYQRTKSCISATAGVGYLTTKSLKNIFLKTDGNTGVEPVTTGCSVQLSDVH